MDLSNEEVGPTEDTILALLDFLVDPLLPSQSCSSREIPSSPNEQLVAKQVHAVVLLYNYYHRKRYQGLDFLDFESFCKMAMSLKPSLQSYLRLTKTTDLTQLKDSDKEHSPTEKAIMNACELCKTLDTLNKNPSMDDWPITRVAVFLVDDKKENCYLFHSSITQGVWSVMEKEVNTPSQISEAVTKSRSGDKKKAAIRRVPKEIQTSNETSLQQLAYAAVKEACGINLQNDLKILENHVVYSINKEKTAVRLYIMQCTLTNQEMNLIPVNHAMECLQGPLVTKESVSWITTPVVEYFHLLPIADKISDWMLRQGCSRISLNSEVQKEATICNSSQLNVKLQPDISNNFEPKNGVEDQSSEIKDEPLVNISQPVEVVLMAEHNSSTNRSNNSKSTNGVGDHNSQLNEEPLVNISPPIEVAMEVEHNNSANPSNDYQSINGVKDHNSQIKEESLMNISQHVGVAMKVEHSDSTNPSNHSDEKTGVEDHNSQLNKEPQALMIISEPVEVATEVEDNDSFNPLNHSEAIIGVKDHNSLLNEEPLALMNISQPVMAREVKHNDIFNLEEEQVENTPQPLSAEKDVGDGSCSLKDGPMFNSPKHAETTIEVEKNKSDLLMEGAPVEEQVEYTPQPLSVEKEGGDGSCSLKDGPMPKSPKHTETTIEVEENRSYLLMERASMEEQVEHTPQPLSVEKEGGDGSCSLKDRPMSNSPKHTETTIQVEENRSYLLMERAPMEEQVEYTLQSLSMEKEFGDGSCSLKDGRMSNSPEHTETTNEVEENKSCLLIEEAPTSQRLLYSLPHSETTKKVDNNIISRRKEKPSETMVYTKRKKSQTNCISNKSPGSKKSNAGTANSRKQNTVTVLSNNTDIDVAVVTCLQANGKSNSVPCEGHDDDKKQLILAEESDPNPVSSNAIVVVKENGCLPISHVHNGEMVLSDNAISACAISNPDKKPAHSLVPFDSNLQHLQKIQLTIASKDNLLAKTALKVLFRKRERLSQQLRRIADDIALCDRSVQTILDGGEDNLDVKLDAMIEACSSECLRIGYGTEDNTNLQIINSDLPPPKKRKILSEATLCVYSPCQELDCICDANSWTLPSYNVSASSEGGFQASVMLKGPDFECSTEGTSCSTPLDARNQAALELLVKLRTMATKNVQL